MYLVVVRRISYCRRPSSPRGVVADGRRSAGKAAEPPSRVREHAATRLVGQTVPQKMHASLDEGVMKYKLEVQVYRTFARSAPSRSRLHHRSTLPIIASDSALIARKSDKIKLKCWLSDRWVQPKLQQVRQKPRRRRRRRRQCSVHSGL